jgi:glycosyltransferase involved in cell wall biosynthesis
MAVNYQNWHGFTDARFGYGSMLMGFLDHKPDNVVIDPKSSVNVHMGVPFSIKGWHKGAYRACFTMWETDVLPTRFARWLGQYDEILVPCEHNIAVFGEHHPKVNYVPLGVDTNWWKPQPRKTNDKFRFQAGGSLWRRKGIDVVVQAFEKLNLPDAELHIKAAPHAADVPHEIPANVFLHRNWMDQETQREWFNQADCFVAPARGEGFGLIPLQTIALGIPTIVSKSSGQEQFSHLAASVVSSRKENCFMGGRWDEPNLEHLMQLMKFHYHHRDNLMRDAQANAHLASEFSWSNAAAKLADHLPVGKKLGDVKFEHPHVLFDMEVTKKSSCEINGKRQQFLPGQVYQVDENVHDIMVAGGYVKETNGIHQTRTP